MEQIEISKEQVIEVCFDDCKNLAVVLAKVLDEAVPNDFIRVHYRSGDIVIRVV